MTLKRIILFVLSSSLLLCITACGETPTVQQTDPAMPSTKAQILQFYNDAVNRAVDSRLSFVKRSHSEKDRFSLSPALAPFESRFKDATGVDQSADDVSVTPQSEAADAYEQYLRRPALTEQDVRSAKCKLTKDGLYRIRLTLADGGSCVEPGRNTYVSALDKCGITTADTTDTHPDHRNAQNVYEIVRCFSQDVRVSEQQTDGVITAFFRSDGTPVQLTIRFTSTYNVKGLYEIGLNAKGITTVLYTQFGAESPAIPEEDNQEEEAEEEEEEEEEEDQDEAAA